MSIYSILIPKVDGILLTPNPVNQNSSFTLKLEVSEVEIQLEPEIRYSGEIYSGEV